jgi:hypothetical protein
LPQTPAQQILMSAADRWGLLGLVAMIRAGAGRVSGFAQLISLYVSLSVPSLKVRERKRGAVLRSGACARLPPLVPFFFLSLFLVGNIELFIDMCGYLG